MSSHYNQHYTLAEIESLTKTILYCIKQNHFTIALNENREENRFLMINYNLNSSKQKEILLSIKPEDFCHSLQNTKNGYEHEILYVYSPQASLYNFDGNEELLDLYLKFNIIEYSKGKRVVVISFHIRNKPIDYWFR